MMLIVVIGCFWAPPTHEAGVALPMSAASLPLFSLSMVAALAAAFRAVLLTYDGWYSPIYLAEENTEPTRTLPRALIGGTLLVIARYVMINLAFLRVLPLPVLAASTLPAADAARVVFPSGGATLVTVISLTTVLSLINAVMLMAPRVLLAIGRDGFFTRRGVRAPAARARHPAAISRVRLPLHDGDRVPRVCVGATRCHHRGPALGRGGWRAVPRLRTRIRLDRLAQAPGSCARAIRSGLAQATACRDPEGSVEVGRQLRIRGVLEHALDLRRRRAAHRQGRQRVAREE